MSEQMSLHIRPLGPEDKAQFLQVRYEALRSAPTAFFTTLEESQAEEDNYFSGWLDLSTEDQLMFGLFDGESLIGITGLSREPRLKRRHIAWIRSVFVKPEYRGQSLGRRLVQHAIDHVRQRMNGVDHIQLSVESSNVRARSVYESLGFSTWGREFPAAKANGVEYGEDYMSLLIDR